MGKLEKTKFGGVYLDTTTKKYVVATTFTTKDKQHKKETKRGFETIKDANTWKIKRADELKTQTLLQANGTKKEMEYLLDEYIKYKSAKCKPTTVHMTLSYLNKYFIKFFDNITLKNIKPIHITQLYDYISKLDVKNQTKNQIIVYIIGFVDWLNLMDYLDNTIVKKFNLILQRFTIIERKEANFFEMDEFKVFISTFDTTNTTQFMLRLLFITLFMTGGRIGEVLAIKYSDIDFTNSRIILCKQVIHTLLLEDNISKYERYGTYSILPYTKTNSIKCVDVPTWLCTELENYMSSTGSNISDFVFRIGKDIISETNLRQHLDKHLKLANLGHIRLHDFRHSSITYLYDNGADAKYVQQRVGHSSPETSLKIYNHVSSKRKEKNAGIIQKIEQL